MKSIQTTIGIILVLSCFIACNSPVVEAPAPPQPAKIDPNPSSAFLSPEESMKSMKLPPGYHLELVASEPVVQEPVAIVWDGNGRMYVAEMRSYMMDINGTGQQLPICRITRLEDTNGDGKMDKHSIFIDSLVLPRMMLAVDDRLIVNETYTFNMFSYGDKNGDGIADEKTLVYHNDTPDNANLEHQKSGLMWNIDNRIYVTYNPVRYRYVNGSLIPDSLSSSPGGQWGLTQNNYGRMFFSSAGGEVAALNFQVNPEYGAFNLANQLAGDFNEVWPIIGTPDVQGGQHRLKADSTLNHFTASCGQSVYRGDRLPESMLGDLFICEPVGRLIRRAKVQETKGAISLSNAYQQREFIASSDMNFRPVNTVTGPDGCLYIVDMYHGIIQESNWTKPDSYLHPQIKRKQLDMNVNRGRIYRLVHDDFKPGPAPRLLTASNMELISFLSHPNGWWRDNAQQLLVIHNDQSVVPALKKIALDERSFGEKLIFWKKGPSALTRLHALWTIEGLGAINEAIVTAALNDADAEIRKAAIRISEPLLKKGNPAIFTKLENMKQDRDAGVIIQLALTLRYSNEPKTIALLKDFQSRDTSNHLLVKAASGSLIEKDESLNELRASTFGMNSGERDLIFLGASNYKQLCATCHGVDGKGVSALLAPPLAGSARVTGDKNLLLRLVLNGLKGPVDHKTYPDQMLPQKGQTDEYIASVLSYIRTNFGHKANMVRTREVKRMRDSTAARQTPWTLDELYALPGSKQ